MKIMIKQLSVLVFLTSFNGGLLFAQSVNFITTGKIEFEKSVNTHPIINRELNKNSTLVIDQQQYEQYKRTQPQFKLLQSTLSFSNDKTLFLPNTETDKLDILSSNAAVEQRNIVYNDLAAGISITQKSIFGDRFLIKDNMRRIEWKITSEVREISGYICRRANAIIMDSVYVVAFYTDEILPPGGPESFVGLPGMILGVVLPHENISWFAKKIVVSTSTSITPPTKGKKVSNKELINIIEGLSKKGIRQQQLLPAVKYLLL